MEFWQLVSVMRVDNERKAPKTVVSSKPEWQEFAGWLENWKTLVEIQDRAKLDYVLPEDLVLSALGHSKQMCFLSNAGIMRSRRASPDDVPVSLAEAYRRYGGDALEDTFEYGSIAVPTV
jgi:hypothetical protein